MKNKAQGAGIRFEVDLANLYRDEGYTDLKSASIRKLTPIKPDGTEDPSRRILFFGHAELISPQGPIPIEAELNAESLAQAIQVLPEAMEKAAEQVRDEYNQLVAQQEAQQAQSSKVIKGTD